MAIAEVRSLVNRSFLKTDRHTDTDTDTETETETDTDTRPQVTDKTPQVTAPKP